MSGIDDVRSLLADGRGGWVSRGLAGPTSDQLRAACRGCDWRFVEVKLAGVSDKVSFMRALAAQLHFPDYFGGNWDAVADCLGDIGDGYEGVVMRLKGLARVPELLAAPFVHILDGEVTGSMWGDDPRVDSRGAWTPFVVVADPPLPRGITTA